jgi:hypothetical protein
MKLTKEKIKLSKVALAFIFWSTLAGFLFGYLTIAIIQYH